MINCDEANNYCRYGQTSITGIGNRELLSFQHHSERCFLLGVLS